MTINDLIHTNAHHAYEQGKLAEQQRIIEIIRSFTPSIDDGWRDTRFDIIERIQKANQQ